MFAVCFAWLSAGHEAELGASTETLYLQRPPRRPAQTLGGTLLSGRGSQVVLEDGLKSLEGVGLVAVGRQGCL